MESSPANTPKLRQVRDLIFWLIFFISSSIGSHYLRNYSDSLLLYLPLAFSIFLIHWYGWKILPIIFINAIVTLLLWNVQGSVGRILLLATHEPLVAAASKLMVDTFVRKHYRVFLSDVQALVQFVFYGFMIPCAVNSIYIYNYSFVNGDMKTVALFWLADFLTVLAIATPVLYFFSPSESILSLDKRRIRTDKGTILLFLLIFVTSVLLSLVLPFNQYWFVYGIGALIIAMRLGFEWALAINLSVFVLNYVLPLLDVFPSIMSHGSTQLANVHVGTAMLMMVALLVGRIISDLRESERNLVIQKAVIEKANRQLKQANEELDRFVYSVSHDLSAPLKSIKGLVGISKFDKGNDASDYLDKIEQSVDKLEDFIAEVLDYSRTTRKEAVMEDVRIQELFDDVLSKFTYLDNFNSISFKTDFQVETLTSDKFLLRVILGNLISNSIKYQKKYEGHTPEIQVRSGKQNGSILLEVIDNGEGIREDRHERVFNMFYRGTSNSTGSGLGLYIAKEAAEKLGGKISFESTYGEGAKFTVSISAS